MATDPATLSPSRHNALDAFLQRILHAGQTPGHKPEPTGFHRIPPGRAKPVVARGSGGHNGAFVVQRRHERLYISNKLHQALDSTCIAIYDFQGQMRCMSIA